MASHTPSTRHVTIVGGGIGGLVAAIAAREAGLAVTLHEAHDELGGRARTTPGPHRANWGPHVIYDDGPFWAWLHARGLARPAARVPLLPRARFRVDGEGRSTMPIPVARAIVRLRRRSLTAPVDATFTDWASSLVGPDAAARVAALMGVATFDHDPGRLSALFVQERLRRATRLPARARYVPGGWGTLVDRLADRARTLGAVVETGSRVDVLPDGPVVFAVPMARAAALLDDPTLAWTGTRTALLDAAFRRERRDPFLASDLDEAGFAEAYSVPDPSLAPPGEHLVQAQVGLRPEEALDACIARAERLLDAGWRDWRDRETWRRRLKVTDDSGAVDLPGTTWRDRPSIDRGHDVHVVTDMSAAPGSLTEVPHAAALMAVASLTMRGDRPMVPGWRPAGVPASGA